MSNILQTYYILLGLLFASGCANHPENTIFSIEDQIYSVPYEHDPNFYEKSEKIRYANIFPKLSFTNYRVHINFSTQNYSIYDENKIPRIFGVIGQTKIEVENNLILLEVDGERVYCDRKYFGHKIDFNFECGIYIEDGRVGWSVEFREEHVPRAREIRMEVKNLLRSYREAADAK